MGLFSGLGGIIGISGDTVNVGQGMSVPDPSGMLNAYAFVDRGVARLPAVFADRPGGTPDRNREYTPMQGTIPEAQGNGDFGPASPSISGWLPSNLTVTEPDALKGSFVLLSPKGEYALIDGTVYQLSSGGLLGTFATLDKYDVALSDGSRWDKTGLSPDRVPAEGNSPLNAFMNGMGNALVWVVLILVIVLGVALLAKS